MEEESYIMWISRIAGIGNKKCRLLLNFFNNASNIFNASRIDFKSLKFLTYKNIDDIIKNQNKFLIEKYETELLNKNIKFISIFNNQYPTLLKEIVDAPIGIYVCGHIPENSLKRISIIGSRRCSEYGLTTSFKLAKDLAKQNIVVVSGMARGIDSMAHKGALEGNGFTIAVFGCGVDICYPLENQYLKEQILENGCIISEVPPGIKPMPFYFPARNRIISGLSDALIVVEAEEKSGTLITVEQALDQGREVMAIPGNVTSKLSIGTNKLIKDGAALVLDYKDVLNEIGVTQSIQTTSTINVSEILATDEKLVYDCISFEPISIEYIINRLGLQPNMVNYNLTMLEMKQLIIRLAGQRYIRSL